MIDENELRKSLLAKREQLVHRIGGTQATERSEAAEGQNDNAQLWQNVPPIEFKRFLSA